jgi:type IV pilus assembly protein PilB
MNAIATETPAPVPRTRIGVMTHLAPKGPLSEAGALAGLIATVDSCLQNRELQLVLDLTAVASLHSAALDTLLDLHDKLVRLGGWLKMSHPNPTVLNVLQLTGVIEYISVLGGPGETPAPSTPHEARRRLGDLLMSRGLLSQPQVEEAMRLQKKLNRRMGQIVVEQGWVSEQNLLETLSEQLGLPLVRLRAGLWDPAVAARLDKEVARRLKVLPLFMVRGILTLATADPQAMPSFHEVEERLHCRVKPVLARQEDILRAINDTYAQQDLGADLMSEDYDDLEVVASTIPDDYTVIDQMAGGSPIINMVNSLIQRAVRDGASDIHFEPGRSKSRIRFRIDGVLYEVMTPRSDLHPALISRLKVMASLDIAERRMPQDGRIQVYTQGRTVDLRFSSLPGLFGEKVVLRVLDKNQAILDLNKLGMSAPNLESFKRLLGRNNGLILVTGPTGSGKTTTLYAALNYLNSIEKNIVTIEDPVEYQVEIINQNEVKSSIGLTFAMMLKHVLRQDPDIVMVGEIRERETAEIAVQAALTGHLVLSTLHTNDSIGAVTRMIEMGVEPYLLSSALAGVMAQRLLRTICPACRTTYLAPPDMARRFGWEEGESIRLARGRGCPECYDSGYKGRLGIHEILDTDEELQRLIMANASRDQLNEYMRRRGAKTLFDDGLLRVRGGLTSIEEVSRAVNM